MLVSELLSLAQVEAYDLRGDADVARMCMDSRKVRPGDLFVAMPSERTDTYQFIPEVLASGAAGVVVFSEDGLSLAPCAIYLQDYEDALWRLCDTLYAHPTRDLKMVGITGTNGKTTTAWIVQQLLDSLGLPSAYIGTLGFKVGSDLRPLANTTPFVIESYNLLIDAQMAGCEAVVMEVSSHALAQKRVEGFEFDAAVFTNLTQDHLDFHGSMEEYEKAKLRLFKDLPSTKTLTKCLNLDDQTGSDWARRLSGPKIGFRTHFGLEQDLVGVPSSIRVDGIEMELRFRGETAQIHSQLGGSYNVENLLSAISAVLALGYPLPEIAERLALVTPVPGRFEGVKNPHGIGVIVDYAHTPDAIEKLLEAAREVTTGRLITVFGCGGDRDATKRPLMATAAAKNSDVVFVTSDNPRTEDPESILDQVCAGLSDGFTYERIADRPTAIRRAIQSARRGDTVAIAGKGHEDYQIIGHEKIHMDDRELAREALSELLAK
ncbi:MAG: UDP-N-acetylmuramoyl-L-alanyl-D-glutamate--2,6-diaminopimelate ligase [Fimbriimonas sp.]|nr:UDP-N-acetylmuramoyl-L-alanyl-D-glutamate--2,6-diaminopimelate ligase [Fimbriimonas sp.]